MASDGGRCTERIVWKGDTMKFPKQIFVTWDESESDAPCLIAWEDTKGPEGGQKVAIYELKEIKTKVVTHGLK